MKSKNNAVSNETSEFKLTASVLEAILQSTVDAIITIDDKGLILSFNPAAESMFSYSADEVIGKNIKMLMPSPYQEEHDSYINDYHETGKKKIIGIGREVLGLRKDGSTFPMDLSVSENKVDDIHIFTGIVRDISERKEAEKKIKESLSFNELIMENIPDLIFVKDSEFRIVQANRSFLNAYPETIQNQLLGTTGVEGHIKEEAEEFNADDKKALEEGYLETEEVIHFPDGKVRTLFTKKIRFEDANGKKFILGVASDITESKTNEEKLAQYTKQIEDQKVYYESLNNDLGAPIFVVDKEHKVITWNKACEELTGLAAHEVIGTQEHWKGFYREKRKMLADLVLDQDFSQLHDLYPENFLKSEFNDDVFFIETWNEMKNGERRYIRAFCNPLRDKEDNIIAVAEVLFDLTQLKESLVALETRQDELQRSNSELERFAYIASHDLQEPLRMVSSYTQLLAKRYKDKLDQDANDYIGFAVDGALRMQSLIQDLLKYSRLKTEVKEFNATDANKLFDYAVQNLAVTIDETGTVVTKDELPMVMGDDGQLLQLFQNLIGNALKYRDQEKINKVHVSAKEVKGAWQFCIEDNGIGIASEYYEKIFVIFKRLHTNTEYKGTGIGLALCKRIIETHNGRIWLESESGEGSRFYFTLMKV